jgi:hypothetical protein
MVARQLAASAKSLIARQRENATRTREKGKERRTGIRTGTVTVIVIATATANVTENGTGTETEITTVIGIVIVTANANATVTVNGTENATAIVTGTVVRGRETVAPGITADMTRTHDGHRVTTAGIVSGIGRATRRETVVTETVIGMPHEEQVREGRTENGVQEGMRKTVVATMTRERGVRQRTMNEVRKCVAFSFY